MKQLKKVEEATRELMERYKVPGAVIAIAQDGEVAYSEGFGFRNLEHALPVTDETVFGLASITKSFTCVAIMHLQEQGKINVHDPVIKYLPEFRLKDKEKLKQITVHHFMTHSSGLPPLSSLEYALKRPDEENPSVYNHVGPNKDLELIDTYEQLMNYIATADFELLEPGKHFSYSNEAYGLLGAIIERASGKTYGQYVYDHVIKPCGMEHTRFTIDEFDHHENITTSYGKKLKDGIESIGADVHWIDSTSMRATGLLKSTAKDMLRYAELFRNGGLVHGTQVISTESVNEMTKPQMRTHLGKYYGYGLRITPDYFGHKLIEHGGSLRSISSKIGILPELGVTAIALANLIGVPASSWLDKVFNEYFGRDINESHHQYEEFYVEPEKVRLYEGEYQSDEGTHVILKVKNDKFVFISNHEEFSTKFIREDVFIVQFNDDREIIEMLMDENDQPYAISCYSRIVHKVK